MRDTKAISCRPPVSLIARHHHLPRLSPFELTGKNADCEIRKLLDISMAATWARPQGLCSRIGNPLSQQRENLVDFGCESGCHLGLGGFHLERVLYTQRRVSGTLTVASILVHTLENQLWGVAIAGDNKDSIDRNTSL
jgi:hypothetical protein